MFSFKHWNSTSVLTLLDVLVAKPSSVKPFTYRPISEQPKHLLATAQISLVYVTTNTITSWKRVYLKNNESKQKRIRQEEKPKEQSVSFTNWLKIESSLCRQTPNRHNATICCQDSSHRVTALVTPPPRPVMSSSCRVGGRWVVGRGSTLTPDSLTMAF